MLPFGVLSICLVLVLALFFFYSMYIFSMLDAHLTALIDVIFGVAKEEGVPAGLAVPLIGPLCALCGCLTNYSTGSVIIYFELGLVSTRRWFYVGAWIGLYHMLIFVAGGMAWWKLLGWY